ncbi:TPA: hypothetical protein UOA81_000868 [Stenotrophomonas maltophilia]|nr:hypothetical protein [Stenotrophomonas maltophilia]
MDKNCSKKNARDGVVTLVRMCGKPFVLRRVDGKAKAFPLNLPDLGPVPDGGGQVLWMWGGVDGDA